MKKLKDGFVQIEFEGVSVSASQHESILELALRAGLDLDHSCGGGASCGTCRVLVESPLEKLAPRNDLEMEMAQERGFSDQERLACQTLVQNGLRIRRPQST